MADTLPDQGDDARRAAFRTTYIVDCIRESGCMYPEDARAYLAEHDAYQREQYRTNGTDAIHLTMGCDWLSLDPHPVVTRPEITGGDRG